MTENPSALRRWMVSGPEISNVNEFEESMKFKTGDELSNAKHHDEIQSTQLAFAKDVDALVVAIKSMGKPFEEEIQDLLILDSKDIADPKVVMTVKQVEALGDEQFQTFITERLINREKPLSPSN